MTNGSSTSQTERPSGRRLALAGLAADDVVPFQDRCGDELSKLGAAEWNSVEHVDLAVVQPRLCGGQEQAKKRLSAAEAKLRKFAVAIEAGVDPAALVESMNQTQAERTAARASWTALRSRPR